MNKIKGICMLFVFGASFCFLPSIGRTATINVNCPGQSLQSAIYSANYGDTIFVSGTCNESVVVHNFKSYITIDGGGSATIQGTGTTQSIVSILGQHITIKNFTLTGANNGNGITVLLGGSAVIDHNTIAYNRMGVASFDNGHAFIINNTIEHNANSGIIIGESSSATIGTDNNDAVISKPNTIQNNLLGINVLRSSSAVIVGNTISSNTAVGIHVDEHSSADIGSANSVNTLPNIIQNNIIGINVLRSSSAIIVGNTISNNTVLGIYIDEHSSADIGIASMNDTTPKTNTIQNNGLAGGVVVNHSSSAIIVGNTIDNNTGNGIAVANGSQADISGNSIDGNGKNGIQVARNSGVNLGNESMADTIFDLPNTTTVNNGDKGITCDMGGYIDGSRGTLVGTHGKISLSRNCINGTKP